MCEGTRSEPAGLLLTLAAGSALTLGGCGGSAAVREPSAARSAYGDDPSQYGDLYLPSGIPQATIVVLHGGYWSDGFGADAMRPMCRVLQAAGFAVWNLEYRRLAGGGGWPTTFTDVAAGIDHLNTFDTVDAADVRLVGHSAGGQLAVWAASRRDTTPGGPSAVTVTRCVSLAGVLDLTEASRLRLGGRNVDLLMGGSPAAVPDHYDQGDPIRLVPAGCPVACVHGEDDRSCRASSPRRTSRRPRPWARRQLPRGPRRPLGGDRPEHRGVEDRQRLLGD